jgi:hypothetical protein
MDHCVETILPGGDDIEIILVDDGSTDRTGEICDRYAEKYPEIVRVIHQENGGHGEGINQGLRHAEGSYFKVVDSDDWLDTASLPRVLGVLRDSIAAHEPLDLFVGNYVYEHAGDPSSKPIRYGNVFPQDRVFSWGQTGRFRPSQYLLMHSVIYRTRLLRDCALELPKHTFYVDNLFVYQPLPYVKTIRYMDLDLYHYAIGRPDQSVNENVMVARADQQLRITKLMIDSLDLDTIRATEPRLARYMTSYLSMMISISSVLLLMKGSQESLNQRDNLWSYLRGRDRALYHKMRYRALSAITAVPGAIGRKFIFLVYRMAKNIYRFN